MSVNIIVKAPEYLKTIAELEDVISRLNTYEKLTQQKAGVLLIQRRSFGGLYEIMTEIEANEWLTKPVLNNPRTCERGLKFYPHEYFEALRDNLQKNNYH